MMEILKAVVLGLVQGLTEFLPISSSGHLVIGSEILRFKEQGVVFDVFLHLGTLVAVLFFFRKEVWAMASAPFQLLAGNRDKQVKDAFLWDVYIVLATLPAVGVGLFLKDSIEEIFGNIVVVYCMLLVTAALMICSKYLPQQDKPIDAKKSFWVGCAQACAILPGLSRSGSTIFVGMLVGIDREKIARFTFIMSIPAILGAAVLQIGDLRATPPGTDLLFSLLGGTIASAISGYYAIVILLDIIRKNRLQWFGYYCLVVATVGLMFHFYIAV